MRPSATDRESDLRQVGLMIWMCWPPVIAILLRIESKRGKCGGSRLMEGLGKLDGSVGVEVIDRGVFDRCEGQPFGSIPQPTTTMSASGTARVKPAHAPAKETTDAETGSPSRVHVTCGHSG